MNKLLGGLTAVVILLAGTARPATAQTPLGRPPYNPYVGIPGYSPYLNLLRPGNAAINYLGLVRPQVEVANTLQQLESQAGALNQDVTNLTEGRDLPPTGHPSQFMNYQRYFLNSNRTSGARPSGRATTGPATPSAPTTTPRGASGYSR